jgi:hypothetical protein
MVNDDRIPPGYEVIFRPYRKNPKTGRWERPKNARVWRMVVPINRTSR